MTDNLKAFSTDDAIENQLFRGHSATPSYSGVTSFLRRSYAKDLSEVDIAITGIPFDCATTNRPGTRLGPRAIRSASSLMCHNAPYGWDIDPLTELNLADFGDLWFDYGSVDKFPEFASAHIRSILEQGTVALSLGGDHYITYPILKAHFEQFGPLALLQFDAHTDTWKSDLSGSIDHGSMFRQAIEMGFIEPECCVQVGIRTANPDTMGTSIIDARSVHENGPAITAKRIKEILGDCPVYVTFDIDSLDPAFAPGTGTPVYGGLTTAQASIILREIAGINVIGMDVVEVSPPYDCSEITAIAAAHVAIDLICLWASGPRTRPVNERPRAQLGKIAK